MADKPQESGLRRLVSKLARVPSSVRFWFLLNIVALCSVVAFRRSGSWPFGDLAVELYGIASNLLQGGLVSFLFYFLVVEIPAKRRSALIKRNLKATYSTLKRSIVWQILFASRKGGRLDLESSFETVDRLLNVNEFRKAFELGREANEGFYAFENQMSYETPEFQELILNMSQLRTQIEYLLNNFDFSDSSTFQFFNRLELHLQRLAKSKSGYDESKALCEFLWNICAGWDWNEGYRGLDRISENIAQL